MCWSGTSPRVPRKVAIVSRRPWFAGTSRRSPPKTWRQPSPAPTDKTGIARLAPTPGVCGVAANQPGGGCSPRTSDLERESAPVCVAPGLIGGERSHAGFGEPSSSLQAVIAGREGRKGRVSPIPCVRYSVVNHVSMTSSSSLPNLRPTKGQAKSYLRVFLPLSAYTVPTYVGVASGDQRDGVILGGGLWAVRRLRGW